MKLNKILSTVVFLIILTVGYATEDVIASEKPVVTDSRIRTYVYNENEVFQITTEYGYQSSIEFGKNEKILTLSVGNGSIFKITPAGNRLFIKALQNDMHTNMTLITNIRTYHFDVSSIVERDEDLIYVMRFFYPEENFDDEVGIIKDVVADEFNEEDFFIEDFISDKTSYVVDNKNQAYNYNYTLSGPDYAAPIKVFDNGKSTFFKFSKNNTAIPSFFIVSPSGVESPAAVRLDGDYVVLDKIVPRIALRQGAEVVCIFNENIPLMKY